MPAFLFTDIEASTRLWEEHPDAMGGALARHDAILRAAVESAGGKIVKTTGDGLMAVFPDAGTAAQSSVAAQLAMAGERWEETGPLRVRMGIHSGDADERDGDYFGPVVNRTARIMAAGHGGQVLLSEAAALMAGPLSDRSSIVDLGIHRLKDLTRPEHLFQVVHSELPTDFPPLATLDARPNNLPVQDSEFFGREAELAAVVGMLDQPATRLVTLTGPGGTGKTRLALQVAADLSDRYPDGVFFVDLSPERDPDASYEAIARALDLSGGPGHPLDTLRSQLRDVGMLLVLDNFEQVAEAAAGVAELLQHCARLEILVTSREALRIRAEHVFPVPPLGLPDPASGLSAIAEAESVRLFADRAQAASPGFAIDEDNAAAIAAICARLDGLPLAIELAAARLNVFSTADLLNRLERRTDVLGSGRRDLPARQRTLRDTIEWSYELLDDDECRLFEMLAVFTGADLDAIEAVAGAALGTLDAIDTLSSLVDKSLVRSGEAGGSRRFSMLHTIREFATERLALHPELEAAVGRAHADHYSAFAQGLRRALEGTGRAAALDELDSEIGNLRTAWRFWVGQADLERLYLLLDGLWALHDARGWYHAAVELARDVLSVLTDTDPSPDRDAEEMVLRTSLARALMAVRGYTVEVEEEFRKALEVSRGAPRPTDRFPVLRALATYYTNLADFARGAEIGQELLDLGDAEDDDSIRVEGHFVYGSNTTFLGDAETGLRHLERAIALFDPAMHVSSRFRLGTSPGVVARTASALIRYQCGEAAKAAHLAAEAIDVARRLDHPFSLAYCLYHVGFFQFVRERFAEAEAHATELAAVAADNDYAIWRALASVLGGVARSGSGRVEEGLAMTEAGFDLYSGLTTPPVFWPYILSLRAYACAAAGNTVEALALVNDAIVVAGDDDLVYPELRIIRGDLIRALPDGDLDEAAAAYAAAIRGTSTLGTRMFELQARTSLVALNRSRGHSPDGSEELAALYATFTEGWDEPSLIRARTILDA